MTSRYTEHPLEAARALLEYIRLIIGEQVFLPATRSMMTSVDQSPAHEHIEISSSPTMQEQSHKIQLVLPRHFFPSDCIFDKQNDYHTAQSLEELYDRIHTCDKCPLGATRTNFVFGAGSDTADIVLIGEAPGADEDRQGEPFVGRAGQLLTKILSSIGLERSDVFICNVLKCRPPNNRTPEPSEIEQCKPYLYKQLELIGAPFHVALGLTAAETLLGRKLKMSSVRGKWFDFYGARLIVTYHPAALLRNPELKRDVWEDVKKLRQAYDEYLRSRTLPEPNELT